MKKDVIKRIVLICAVISISALFIYATKTNVVQIAHVDYPTQMNFAQEEVPTFMADVEERLDREMVTNMNYHTNTTLVIKRANKVFPVIEPILAKNGIPDDFKYLAVIESSLVNAVSPAGARGVWQFMPTTAKEKGMEVNDYVDERYDLEKATEAACAYLKEAYLKFGNWTLAAASYNGGMAGVQRQLESQKVNSYYDVLLTEETARYVYRILALKEIMKNPQKYGFEIPAHALYSEIPVKKIEVDSTVTDLADFAISQGINYKILKIHNPWLRDKSLPNKSKKKYQIAIPTSGYSK
ncbi:lytic transglycosylase domain-containing protein [Flavobacterium jejuense]|uniref:Lytic transglycosylase domain-containing protein n=1 Tax=Flavobacterium jejuense TaxID=1544455 RepID=A0ABX0IPF1_9FLAO|nr:lytic transglycosylase domain-containing protein [Flavobacterium jejuense]NHN24679.1 lytic transglycosylase domain-containing protein [Flavobacterium jejuense]